MYRDVAETDCMRFEKLLSAHESISAQFIRRILKEEDNLSLTRTELGKLKKFQTIMMYRNEHRRMQYFDQRFDDTTRQSVKLHMEHNNIIRYRTVWFQNFKWLLMTSVENILGEYMKYCSESSKLEKTGASPSLYRGPIHGAELQDFGYLLINTIICIWQAEEGSEFVLSDNCFGDYEGGSGIWFHNIFIVSPRFAIILVNTMYLNEEDRKKRSWKSMFQGKFHDPPEIIYKKGPLPKSSDYRTHSTCDDIFKFKPIIVPKEVVYKVNGIILDERFRTLTYKCKVSMYKSMRYYDKVKERLFHERNDYSILKKQLFFDLNRTHPVQS